MTARGSGPCFANARQAYCDRGLAQILFIQGQTTGADLLWRVRKNVRLDCERRLPDGSYLSRIYRSTADRVRQRKGMVVRVMECRLEAIPGDEPLHRRMTTILDHRQAPAKELAPLYHERWEIETSLDELKTHLPGARIVLRSKTPELARQEFYGLLMAHFALRGLMHEAALQAGEDPDRLSFLHAVRVVQRRLPRLVAIPPSERKSLSWGDADRNPGGARGLQQEPHESPRRQAEDEQVSHAPAPA